MIRVLLLIASASMGAILFILLRENATGVLQLQGGSLGLIGAPAPIAGFALAFPAVYLLWEHNDG